MTTTRIGLLNDIAARKHEIEQLKTENQLHSTTATIAHKNIKIMQLLARLNDLDAKQLQLPEFQA